MDTDHNSKYEIHLDQMPIKFFKPIKIIKVSLSKSYDITCDIGVMKDFQYLYSNNAEFDFRIELISAQGISLDISSEQPRIKQNLKIIKNPIVIADHCKNETEHLQ
jgi:hypothetical protein